MQPSRPLVERDAERAELVAAVGAVAAGEGGRALVVEGDAGIGKSRLLDLATDLAEQAGLTVLRAHGTELESDLAYGATRQLLDPIVALPPADRDGLFTGPAALARGVLGVEVGSGATPADPLHGLYWLVRNLGERRPVALVVDDLHWLDPESARWVSYLVRRISSVPALLVVARRPGAGHLGDDPAPLRPRGLSTAGVEVLLRDRGLDEAAARYAAECREVTGGNPFLVGEVAASLASARAARDALAVPDRLAVPGVGRSVLARATQVSPVAVDLVRSLAVFPDGAEVSDVAAITAHPAAEVAAAASALATGGILQDDDRLRFRHPLMRSSLYDLLDPHQRRQLHLEAADRLSARGVPLEQVAAHLLAAEPSGNPEHVRVLEAVAEESRARGAPRAAARYLERALAEPPNPEDRWRIAWTCGCLQALVGDDRCEDTLRVSALRAATTEERADSALQLAAVQYGRHRPDDAVETLLPLRSAGDLDAERRLVLEALLAASAWESTRHGALYAAVADALPTDLAGATAGERMALVQAASRLFDRCRPWPEVLAVLRRSVGHDPPLVVGGTDLGDPLNLIIACGDLSGAREIALRREVEARAAGHDAQYAAVQIALARLAYLAGDLVDAEAILDLALELPVVQDLDRHMLRCLRASVAIARGDHDHADALLAAAEAAKPRTTSVSTRRARLARIRGRDREAVAGFAPAYDVLAARGSQNPAETMWATDYAAALAATGEASRAREILEGMLRAAEAFGAPQPLGVVHRDLGLTLEPDRTEHLVAAVDVLEPSAYRHDAALAHLALGSAFRRAGHRRDARPHLQAALDHARRQGARPLAHRAEEELAASGARLQRRATSGVDALTPSERRVCDLAARGMSNREIADHLFLTVKTIEMHLGRSFRKLGVGSRHELAAALAGGR